MINMKRVKDFGNGVRKVGRMFVVSVGQDEQMTSAQDRIIQGMRNIFAPGVVRCIIEVNRAVYSPYTPPREFEPVRCDVYG